MTDAIEIYRQMIIANISYYNLCERYQYRKDELDEIVELMTETLCSRKKTIRIGGEDKPAEIVMRRMIDRNSLHIEYIMESLNKNTTEVRNIKSYLLTTIYNAPITIGNYYKSQVNYDLHK